MVSKVETLPTNLDIPSSHLSSPLFLSEQALLVPTVERPPVSSAKLKAVAIIAVMPLHCSTLEPVALVLIFPSTFLLPSYSLSNFYLIILSYHTIVQ